MAEIIVIGIGNPFRSDDGAGWAVIDALEGKVTGQIKLSKLSGDFGELLDYFGHYSTIYLIDACIGNTSGLWRRIDLSCDSLPLGPAQTSTHGMSVSQAISLAKVFNQLPSKFIIYAINSEHYNVGNDLSLTVAAAIPAVVQRLLQEEDIRKCMNKV